MIFSAHMPMNRVAGLYGSFIPSILKNLHTVLHNGCISLHSHQQCKRVSFSSYPLQHLTNRFFDDGHSHQCEVILHCIFDLHFSNNEQCWGFFHMFIGHLYVFLGKMTVQVCPIFDWVVCFSDIGLHELLTYFGD